MAASHPALGFTLSRDRWLDVQAWGLDHATHCAGSPSPTALTCTGIAAASPGDAPSLPISSLFFAFDLSGRLASVAAVRRTTDGPSGQSFYDHTLRSLEHEVGAPAQIAGEPPGTLLLAAGPRQARSDVHRSDYAARLTLTKQGPHEYVLTEHYEAIAE